MSIKKFAKFGIVLVAAITVATAAQSQGIGITQKVYANEDDSVIVLHPTDENTKSFYENTAEQTVSGETNQLSLWSVDLNPGESHTLEVPERDGYTYTITAYSGLDDTGKTLEHGYKLAYDDPILKDTASHRALITYMYYPNTTTSEAASTAPSTSEAASTAPSTSEAASTAPSTSEAASTAPSTSEAASTAPSTSEAASTAPSTSEAASTAPVVEKPSQKADDKTTATEKAKDAKVDKKADSKKANDKVKVEKSKDTTSEKTVAAKDDSTSKTAEASALAEQAKATVKANANKVNPSENSQAIVKQADGTVDTAAVHNDNTGFFLTMLGGFVAAFIGLRKTKKE